jgi:hypothetical protein
MHSEARPVRERIIATEVMKLERRAAIERSARRALSGRPDDIVSPADEMTASRGPAARRRRCNG